MFYTSNSQMCNPAQTAQAKYRMPASRHFENLVVSVGITGDRMKEVTSVRVIKSRQLLWAQEFLKAANFKPES